MPGFGIAAVHTVKAFRRRGYANQLCRGVAKAQAAQGDWFGILFSDIPCGYYEAMGYQVVSENQFICRDLSRFQNAQTSLEVRPLSDPNAEISSLMHWYNTEHRRDHLWIARDEEYWKYSLQKLPTTEFWILRDLSKKQIGYVRVEKDDDSLIVMELALADPNWEQPALVATGKLAANIGAKLIGGWLRDNEVTRAYFEAVQRSDEIPMVCPLGPVDLKATRLGRFEVLAANFGSQIIFSRRST